MSAYREPGEMPDYSTRPKPDPDRWLMRGLWTFVLVMGCLLGWKMYHLATDPPKPPSPCSTFAEWPAKDVPARCTKNFDGEKP